MQNISVSRWRGLAYIKVINALEVIFLDFVYLVVLKVNQKCICWDVLWHTFQTCEENSLSFKKHLSHIEILFPV